MEILLSLRLVPCQMTEIKTNKSNLSQGAPSLPYEISFGESSLSCGELGHRKWAGNKRGVKTEKGMVESVEWIEKGWWENRLREAALFLVSTIYTSIRNNDGCHRME